MKPKGYLEELRRLVGTRLLVVPGACVMIRDELGRVLLHRRADSGAWDVIGGSMEPGETFEQTARREVEEEIGVTLGELDVVRVYSGASCFHTYPNGDQVNHVGVAFQTRGMRGQPTAGCQRGRGDRLLLVGCAPGPTQSQARASISKSSRRRESRR